MKKNEIIHHDQLQEQLFYERLNNGLDVYILPKKNLTKHMRRLQRNTVRWITTLPRMENNDEKVPDGIAHF